MGGVEVARRDLAPDAPEAASDGPAAALVLAPAPYGAAARSRPAAGLELSALPPRREAVGPVTLARAGSARAALAVLPVRACFVGASACPVPGFAAARAPSAAFGPAAVPRAVLVLSVAPPDLASPDLSPPDLTPPDLTPPSRLPVSRLSAASPPPRAGGCLPAGGGGAPRACLGGACLGMDTRDSFGRRDAITCTPSRAPACPDAANPLHPPLSRQGGPVGRMP